MGGALTRMLGRMPAAGSGGVGSHRYWRLKPTCATSTSATELDVAEIEMYSTIGGSDLTTNTGGAGPLTPSQPNDYDNNYSSYFGPPLTSTWVPITTMGYDFGAGNEKDIVQIGIVARTSWPDLAPGYFGVDYSDDGVTWTRAFTVYGVAQATYGSGGSLVKFTAMADPSSTKWRLYNYNGGNLSSAYSSASEIQMRSTVGGSNIATGGTATASSVLGTGLEADKAFDGNNATLWHSGAESGAGANWIQYEFASSVTIREVVIRSRSDTTENNTAMRQVLVQYYDTGSSSWKTFFGAINTTAYGTGETRTFSY